MLTRAACGAVAVAFAFAACSHTYYLAGSSVPKLDGHGELVIERFGQKPTTRRVNSIAVALASGEHRLATPDELATWARGETPAGVQTIAVDVSTTREVWLDYGLPAAGIGMTLVLAVVTPFAGKLAADSNNGLTVPLVLLIAAVAGAEFGLVGAGVGAAVEGGSSPTDSILHPGNAAAR